MTSAADFQAGATEIMTLPDINLSKKATNHLFIFGASIYQEMSADWAGVSVCDKGLISIRSG